MEAFSPHHTTPLEYESCNLLPESLFWWDEMTEAGGGLITSSSFSQIP